MKTIPLTDQEEKRLVELRSIARSAQEELDAFELQIMRGQAQRFTDAFVGGLLLHSDIGIPEEGTIK